MPQIAALAVVPILGPLCMDLQLCPDAQNVYPPKSTILIISVLTVAAGGYLWPLINIERCRLKAVKCWPVDPLRLPLFLGFYRHAAWVDFIYTTIIFSKKPANN